MYWVTLTRNLYEDIVCSESFKVKTRVRQGCLHLFMLILAVDWLMKETTTGRTRMQ